MPPKKGISLKLGQGSRTVILKKARLDKEGTISKMNFYNL